MCFELHACAFCVSRRCGFKCGPIGAAVHRFGFAGESSIMTRQKSPIGHVHRLRVPALRSARTPRGECSPIRSRWIGIVPLSPQAMQSGWPPSTVRRCGVGRVKTGRDGRAKLAVRLMPPPCPTHQAKPEASTPMTAFDPEAQPRTADAAPLRFRLQMRPPPTLRCA